MKKEYCYICNKEIESSNKLEFKYFIILNKKEYNLCYNCINDIVSDIKKRKSRLSNKRNKKIDIQKSGLKAKIWKNNI